MEISSMYEKLHQYGLALTLGSAEVSLVDLTNSYSVLANLGVMAGRPAQNPRPGYRTLDPVAVLRIEDQDGKVLWQLSDKANTLSRANVLNEGIAYLVTNILSDNSARLPPFGQGNPLEL